MDFGVYTTLTQLLLLLLCKELRLVMWLCQAYNVLFHEDFRPAGFGLGEPVLEEGEGVLVAVA